MKAVIYCRVSTEDQTTDNQIVPLRKYAEAMGYTIVKEYTETGSGSKSDREQFNIMLNDADKHHFDIILIWSLDRFSREGIHTMFGYIERLKRAKVDIKSLQEGWLTISDSGIGQVLLSFMAWVAQQERLRISERTKAAYKRKADEADKKEEKPKWGRPLGSKDKGYRCKTGYRMMWQGDKRDKRINNTPQPSLCDMATVNV